MKKQNYELKNERIRTAFLDLKATHPEKLKTLLQSLNCWCWEYSFFLDSARF